MPTQMQAPLGSIGPTLRFLSIGFQQKKHSNYTKFPSGFLTSSYLDPDQLFIQHNPWCGTSTEAPSTCCYIGYSWGLKKYISGRKERCCHQSGPLVLWEVLASEEKRKCKHHAFIEFISRRCDNGHQA